MTPATFEGEYDPETASRWLKEVMRIFRLTVVPESFQVECATYLLRSSALKWWELQEEYHDTNNLTLVQFERLFRENYIPEANKHEMIAQFSRLVQADMTVAEYYARFINLSRYDPSAVANPISRCIKFREGLRPNIRSQLAPFSFTEFHELFSTAQCIENDILRNKEVRKRYKNSGKKKENINARATIARDCY